MAIDPISALISVIPSLAKAGTDIAAASDEAKRNAQLIEFQRVIIQLQSSIAAIQNQNSSLLHDKDELEKQIVGMKNWEAEKQRYALQPIFENTAAVYALKESMSNGEAPHWLCPNCFESGKKSFLHPRREDQHPLRFGVACSACPTKIPGPWSSAASPEYAQG